MKERRMPNRTHVLSIVLGCALLALAGYLSLRERPSPATARAPSPAAPSKASAKAPPKVSPAFDATWAAIVEADKIEDPVQRCIAYPDPPDMHWAADVVKAVCTRTGFKYPSIDDIAKALDEGHIDTIERTYQEFLDQGATQPEKRGLLATAFRATFEAKDDKVQGVLDRWVATAPASAFALAARGQHAVEHAGEVRGEEVIGRTDPSRLTHMGVILEGARKDLKKALQINPRLTAAYRGLFYAARMHGNPQEIAEYAQAALKVDATDDRIYLDWIAAREPRWGGSMEEMAEIARMASQHRDKNPYLDLVGEKPSGDTAYALHARSRDPEALAEYEKALRIAPSPTDFGFAGDAAMAVPEPEKALWYYSQAYRFSAKQTDYLSRANALLAMDKREFADRILDNASAKGSSTPGAMAEIGDALWRKGQYRDAEKAFLAELRMYPKDSRTLKSLTHLYVTDLHDVDKAQPYIITLITSYPADPRGWLYKSAGNKPKAETLDALKRYLQLVNRDDPYEQQTIPSVEAKIRTLEQEK